MVVVLALGGVVGMSSVKILPVGKYPINYSMPSFLMSVRTIALSLLCLKSLENSL